MQKKLPKLVLAAAVGVFSFAPLAMAREGDKSIKQVQMSDLPEAVRNVVKDSFEGAEHGRVWRVDNAEGEQFAATFNRGEERFIMRLGADGKVIEEAREQTEADRTFLASAFTKEEREAARAAAREANDAKGTGEDAKDKMDTRESASADDNTPSDRAKSNAKSDQAKSKDGNKSDKATARGMSEEEVEAQLASAMEEAEKRTPVGENDLPEAVRDKSQGELKDATHVGRYRLENGQYLIHYRTPEGQMKEMQLDNDGSFVQEPREREILNLTMQVRRQDVPQEVMQTIDRELAEAKVENPENARYFRVGEDDYSVQFRDDNNRRMGLRVDSDGAVVTPLRELKGRGNRDNSNESREQQSAPRAD